MSKFNEAHDLVQQGFVSVNSSTRIGAIRLKETILEALLVADKLTEEPSEAMIEAARNREEIGVPIYAEVFKAMRDQLLKELGL